MEITVMSAQRDKQAYRALGFIEFWADRFRAGDRSHLDWMADHLTQLVDEFEKENSCQTKPE